MAQKSLKEGMVKKSLGTTDNLMQFVVKTKYTDLPNEVTEQGKACFLDLLGAGLAGSKELPVSILTDLATEMGENAQATILGRGLKTSVINAALINGVMSHVLDIDDTYLAGKIHAAALVPAILSIKDVITAFV